jgi:hypothetical protein
MIIQKMFSILLNSGRRIGTYRAPQFLAIGFIVALTLPLINCGGGGGGGGGNITPQNPIPVLTTISPAGVFTGSRPITLSVSGTGFISSSVVRWNGSDRTTTYVSSSRLTASIQPADLSITGSASVTVFNPSPGGGVSAARTFAIAAVSPLSILTARLPDAQNTKAYDYTLQASGGIPPYLWSVIGSLPSGLNLDASSGKISGTPPAVAADTNSGFSIQISDDAYIPNTLAQPLNILVRANKFGRNETCNTATSITNGITRASLSPYGDIDVYSFQGTAGHSVTAEIYAQRLSIYDDASTSRDVFIDSFLEILDSNCSQLAFNDDITSGLQDSRILGYLLQSTGTYYIRVSDLRGDGRPDFIYELHLSGAD